MADSQLRILMTLKDEASAKMGSFSRQLKEQERAWRSVSLTLTATGGAMTSVGVLLNKLNNDTANQVSNFLIWGGAVASTMGSIIRLLPVLANLARQLKQLAIAQALLKAFSGPVGWIGLGVGVAAITGTMLTLRSSGATERRPAQRIVIENKTILDGRQIGIATRREILLDQERNSTSGFR